MNSVDHIIRIIAESREQLRSEFGVIGIGIFGSVVRGEQGAGSEVLQTQAPTPHGEAPKSLPRPRFSGRRLALAFTMAALADGLSVFLTLTPPVQWSVDLATAILLFMVLGRQWILLPGLIMEAIPGLCVFPFWVLVVGAVALWGTARPKLNGRRKPPDS